MTNLQVSDRQGHALTLTWINPTDLDLAEIVVRQATGPNAPASVTDGVAVPTWSPLVQSVTATDLEDGRTYAFSVFAIDDNANVSAPSQVTGSTLDITSPGPVGELTVSERGGHSVSLNWVNPGDPDLAALIVRRQEGPTPPQTGTQGTEVPLDNPLAHSVLDSGLLEDTLYSYAVFATDDSGNTSQPSVLTVRTLDVTPPGPVSGFSAGDPSYGSIGLSWTNPQEEDAFRVVVRMAQGSDPVGIDEGELAADVQVPTHSVRVSELEGGVPYTFTAYVIDTSGNASTGVSVTTSTWASTPLPAPGNLKAEATDATSVHVSWTNPPESLARIRVYRLVGLDQTSWGGTELTLSDPLAQEVSDSGLEKEGGYTYSVVAWASDGRMSRALTSVQMPDLEPPHVVWQLYAGLIAPDTATLNWVNPYDADLQKIIVRRAQGTEAPQQPTEGEQVETAAPLEEGLTDAGLEYGTTYTYSVFALDEADNHGGPVSTTVTTPDRGESLTGHVVIHTQRDDMTPPSSLSSGVEAVAAGQDHALAIKDGGIVAWGSNPYHETDVPAEAMHDIKAIAAGPYKSVALTASGKVLAWGYPCFYSCSVPTALQAGVTDIAAGGSWYYGVKDGAVYGSGLGLPGPPPAEALSSVTAVAAGPNHALAVKNGAVIAWGETGTVPWVLSHSNNIVDVAAGIDHSLALSSSGTVYAWNDQGVSLTVPKSAVSRATAIAAGHWHSVVLKNGGVKTWNASFGLLPDDAWAGVTAVSASSYYTLALRQDLPSNP